ARRDGAARGGAGLDLRLGALHRRRRARHRHAYIRRLGPAQGAAAKIRLRAGARDRDRKRAGGRQGSTAMTETPSILFLFDVDNTLLDNDRVQAHLKEHLAATYGAAARDRYWDILEQLREELGYVDYLGALERFRIEEMHRPDVLRMSSWLVEYPFADRLYPGALSALKPLHPFGPPLILS